MCIGQIRAVTRQQYYVIYESLYVSTGTDGKQVNMVFYTQPQADVDGSDSAY